jgi:hypothetical protein
MRFGRYKGVDIGSVPRLYLVWLRKHPTITTDLREAITATLSGKPKTAPVHHRPTLFDAGRAAANDRD